MEFAGVCRRNGTSTTAQNPGVRSVMSTAWINPRNQVDVRVGGGLIAVALCLSMATSAQAIIISASQNAGTAGLGVSPVGSWHGVGAVGMNTAAPSFPNDFFCTGTVLDTPQGGKWVLTAAHCTYHPVTNLPFGPTGMSFHLPYEPGFGGTFWPSQTVHRHPNWLLGDWDYDVALIELGVDLSGPNGTSVWKINEGQIADERANGNAGLVAHKVGYGAGGDGVNGETLPYGVKREGINFVDGFGYGAGNTPVGLYFDFDNHLSPATWMPTGGSALGNNEAVTTHGDSGGPMFMFDFANSIWRIVGTTRGGDVPAGIFQNVAWDVRTQTIAPWINSIVPEPGTLALLMGGATLILARRRTK